MARLEIVFFDVETTVPGLCIVEFGAIVVCPKKLVEVESYCSLIRPQNLSVVAVKSGRGRDGITRSAVCEAPSFDEVADEIYRILDGRIWAGHNIRRFDCIRIKEAFALIGRKPPVPTGIIDSLGLLTDKFGRRAGNMKMATLANYFGLGQQKHRSLEDVRMNLEVVKHCATVLFLESSLPKGVLLNNNPVMQNSPNVMTRSRSLMRSGKSGDETPSRRKSPPSTPTAASSYRARTVPYARASLGKMTTNMKNVVFSCARRPVRPLNNLLKHAQSPIE